MSRGGHNWKGHGTVEGNRSLDVMKLSRAGCLSNSWSGRWGWTDQTGTKSWIQIKGGREAIVLNYRVKSGGEDWTSVQQRVPIRWTQCRLGGERPWLVCDVTANGVQCGRHAAKLYGAGRLFACRHCYQLGYQVQRGAPIDRAHQNLARLHRKLKADYDGPDQGLPPRPKWMRQRTYDRIADRIEAGEERLDVIFTVGAQGILARLDGLESLRRIHR